MRVLLHSNAIVRTGYALEALRVAKRMRAAGHEVVYSAPFALGGAVVQWEGFTILPGGTDPFGSDTIAGHYRYAQAELCLTLCDVFAMNPEPLKVLNVAHWTPVDCDRLGAVDAAKLQAGGGAVIAMSRFGEARLREASFSPYYAPHSVDTALFRPLADRDATRTAMGLTAEDFAVGINAANKAGPRKAYPEQMYAFAKFHRRHPSAKLLIHAMKEPPDGVNLKAVADNLGITEACFFPASEYEYVCGMIGDDAMASWAGTLDVLLNATFGEGFGLCPLDAQACGTPVITTAASAMPEVNGAGWSIGGQPHWVPGHNAWWCCPSISAIDWALEQAWQAREDGKMPALRAKARAHALTYDADTVFAKHWVPILGLLDERRVRVVGGVPPRKGHVGERRDLAVLVPSRGRPESVKRLAAACGETCRARTDLIFAFDVGDPTLEESCAAAAAGQAQYVVGPRDTLTGWTNALAMARAGSYRALASLGDDHVPRTDGWDTALLAAIEGMGGTGFAYPNDQVRDDIPEAVVVSSDIVAALGWMANPACSHFYIDNTWADLGKFAGCITYLPDVVVEHLNPASGKAAADQVNLESSAKIAADERAYQKWRTARFRGDVATLRALRASKGNCNVKADYRERLGLWSDVQDHLPYLHRTAARIPGVRVLELGVRSGFSTSAFLAAAAKAGGHVWSVDVDAPSVPRHWHKSPLWTFTQADDLTYEPPSQVDVLFADTSHDYGHTLAELERFVPCVVAGGRVLVHDTKLKTPHEAPAQEPFPVRRALTAFCGARGLSWKEHGGVYGLGEIVMPGGL
jgi:glycosyltransferase involved in cell wall biosynthesis